MFADKVFPYVVPDQYLQRGDHPFSRSLGNGLSVVLVMYEGDVCRNIVNEELGDTTAERIWDTAIRNLEQRAHSGAISKSMHSGENGAPFIVWGGHMFAASCVVVPWLFDWARDNLRSEKLLVSLPQQQTMIIFSADHSDEKSMKALIREAEADARKPLTWELFSLSAEGLRETDR